MPDNHDAYFSYLQQRSRLGLWYRTRYLYPRLSRYLRAGRVLDVGCGIGDLLRFRRHTVGVDINTIAVAWCRAQGLDAVRMEPDRLPFPDADFDGAMLDNVLEHIVEPEPILSEIHRVLRNRGHLIVGVPGQKGYASDPDHKVFYDQTRLVKTVTARDFSLIRVLHMPLRSRFLDKRLRQYALYGIFVRT